MYQSKIDSTVYTGNLFLILSIFLLATFIACQPRVQQGSEKGSVDTTAIIAAIDSLRATYQQAVADGNFEKLSALVTDDAVMVQPGAAAWQTMREGLQAPFPPGATIQITPREIQVLSDKWVYEMGNSTVTFTQEGSEEPTTLRDTYLVILKKTADGWKVHREVASSYLQDISAE